jgi:hypothetical protein
MGTMSKQVSRHISLSVEEVASRRGAVGENDKYWLAKTRLILGK